MRCDRVQDEMGGTVHLMGSSSSSTSALVTPFISLLLVSLSATVVSPQRPLLVLSESCHRYHRNVIDTRELQRANLAFKMLDRGDVCDDHQKILDTLSVPGGYVVGSLEPSLCPIARFMSTFYNSTLLTWNCPRVPNLSTMDRTLDIGPSIEEIARSFARLVAYMKWKSIGIVASGTGWWPILAQSVDFQLRDAGIVPRLSVLLPENAGRRLIETKLQRLKRQPCRAVIVCTPASALGKRIFLTLDRFRLANDHNTLSIAMDVSAVPSWIDSINSWNDNESIANATEIDAKDYDVDGDETDIDEDLNLMIRLTYVTKTYLLVYTDRDDFNQSLETGIDWKLRRTVEIVRATATNRSYADDLRNESARFRLLDTREDDSLRTLLTVRRHESDDAYRVDLNANNFDEWSTKHKKDADCDSSGANGCDRRDEFANLLSVIVIFTCSTLFVCLLLGVAAIARYHLLKKRINKGPYKVLLTATDFVFPQIADSRRVDEGIEAMLCCWLQQLQEFGGPEVDKPDLLQTNSSGNARTPLRGGGSSPSLAKQLIMDPRVRYNGDLVQMKPLPTVNNAELKAKSIEILVVLHGLRHENINPLIGCLAEPPRAALVSEWCARGSLQDVLQQDDIKLDWSFRLSLLTDLVRGMKYLHSTPIRVHGYLTSRNCVIDARWVLKVTDYGLPSFYEAQGITPSQKSARELLWTAPELLRHSSLRKKGTQPGDVYSFGIILQEVVVRGEPFCMLALTPEEIIEKVKRPPPLIRPSVSKGAAPPEAINIMRQCWAEQADMRPDFCVVHDQFKKLNHGRKVNIVDTMFQMLEKYSNNLEELIRDRTEQLDVEKKKTEQLLNRMLPSSVAEKLKLGMPVDPEEFEEVTIYFSDIVGFTTISAHSTPFQVVDLLNDLYTCFDATINAYNVYKVETIGDAYMVVGGLPVRVPDHAEQIATMALDLLHQSGRFRIRHLPGTPLRLRIGLHTGPCCAGVVGLTMPRYCLFGDTVNTASRMESTGAAWRIHLSQQTKERLERSRVYQIEYRGPTEIKGKGTMDTYWLLGKSGFEKTLPTPPPLEESHGLDENLIVRKSISNAYLPEDSSSSSGDPSQENPHPILPFAIDRQISTAVQAIVAAPDPPTFIRTMEHSKFSSLIKDDHHPPSLSTSNAHQQQQQQQQQHHMVKSTSSDTPMSLGTPVSASEVAAALLGASTNSLCGFRSRHGNNNARRIEEEDLSTPYNHYRCLSPKERTGKSLRRQFSLDRTDESSNECVHISPRLYKQNSAGAADLEKIEEAPLANLHKALGNATTTMASSGSSNNNNSAIHCTLSISVDSLIR